jgi:hypothetical protein
MSVRELPDMRQHEWLMDSEGASSRPAAIGLRWSARHALKWGAIGSGIVASFLVGTVLTLMVIAPEATSYLG